MDFLKDLNDVQREAVTSIDGPVMVLAGAGSGKTRVLTYRCAFAIDQGIDSFHLLALTFTNKAAKEMKDRIHTLVGGEARNIWMGTFHSTFARILRREAALLGYTNNFTIYDDDDSEGLLKRIIHELNLDDKQFKPRVMMQHISGAKNALVDPEEYALKYVTDSVTNTVSRIYKIYNTRLFQSNAMDFDDLLMKPVELFRQYQDRLAYWQDQFRFVMVDEFQDTNHAQYLITQLLSEQHRNLCVVGDDAQSIYSFRGANIQNILNFKKDYPETRIYKLEQNYRSTVTIVEAANVVISHNKKQLEKKVFTENENGDPIIVTENVNEADEARMVTDSIREQRSRFSFRNQDFAILYRTNAQSRAVETELRRAGIRYRVFGGLSFYKRKEIKDVVAYLKLAVNPKDEAALFRIINFPARGIGKTTMDRISVFADERRMPVWEALEHADKLGLGTRASKPISDFVVMLKNFAIVARDKNAYDAAHYIAQHSGLLKELHADRDTEGLSRWENVQELLTAAKEYSDDPDNDSDKLDAFLAEISLLTDADNEDPDPDYVSLMTIHSAKGLEFPSVFIVGLEEGLFPSFMSLNSRDDLEEERRLFYVAITRSRKKLTLSYAKSRFRYGQLNWNEPSRFIEEIDSRFLHQPSQRETSRVASPVSAPRSGGLLRTVRRGGPAPAAENDFEGDDLSQLQGGMKVLHPKFGEGKVLNVEGAGLDRKATVFFNDKGNKVLLLKYAKMKIVG